jgi:hypothetical protein
MNDDVRRATRLSLIPGITIAEAAQKTGVAQSAIRRARKDKSLALTRDDLLLAALTRNGEIREGRIDDAALASIASWVDYVNHDGTTATEVRADLDRLSASKTIAFDGNRYRLLVPWP